MLYLPHFEQVNRSRPLPGLTGAPSSPLTITSPQFPQTKSLLLRLLLMMGFPALPWTIRSRPSMLFAMTRVIRSRSIGLPRKRVTMPQMPREKKEPLKLMPLDQLKSVVGGLLGVSKDQIAEADAKRPKRKRRKKPA